MTDNQAKSFRRLLATGVFCYGTPEQEELIVRGGDDDPWSEPDIQEYLDEVREYQATLNMNDVFGWALAFGQKVPDGDLEELDRLVKWYGYIGAIYYTSEKNGAMRSEFEHYQRAIDFVREEEKLRTEHPNPSDLAYFKASYALPSPVTPS